MSCSVHSWLYGGISHHSVPPGSSPSSTRSSTAQTLKTSHYHPPLRNPTHMKKLLLTPSPSTSRPIHPDHPLVAPSQNGPSSVTSCRKLSAGLVGGFRRRMTVIAMIADTRNANINPRPAYRTFLWDLGGVAWRVEGKRGAFSPGVGIVVVFSQGVIRTLS
jgi:hypothetical protein